jgi:iron complex outermembrane receptor protein
MHRNGCISLRFVKSFVGLRYPLVRIFSKSLVLPERTRTMPLKLSKPNLNPIASAVLIGIVAPTVALAQDAGRGGAAEAPGLEPQGPRLDRVVIQGGERNDTELRRRSQVAKQVYGREELDKFGDTNVADVLKRLPGVTLQGNAPRMRGLGSDYTIILLNGDRAPPGFSLDQVSPEQVERIEISKAPTADQSAQAIAGSINIILKEAPRLSQRDLRLNLGLSPNRPRLGGNFTLGEKFGALSLSLPISGFEWRRPTDVVNRRDIPGLDGQFSQVIQSGRLENYGRGVNIGPRLSWKLSDDETLTWQSFLQKGVFHNDIHYTNQILQGNPSLEDDSTDRGTWQNIRSNLQWTNYLSATQSVELKGGLQNSRSTFDNRTFRSGVNRLRAVGDNLENGVTQAGKFTQILDGQHSVTVGWDLELRQRDEERTVTVGGLPQLADYEGRPFSARIEREALFIQDEWEISKQWSANLGIRGERIRTTSKTLDLPVSNESSVLTPLLHLNYKFDPKARDLIRASLTRSYKPPGLATLMARPTINRLYDNLSQTNTELAPDRDGNSTLRPELATGLDLAYETYLPDGGLISIGVFSRQIENLVRNVTSLQTVAYASAPRWISRPTNFATAQTQGLELEVKGRAGELMPSFFERRMPLNLRAAVSFYHSSVDTVPGPNNRLDAQQPWSGTLGADYRMTSLPVTAGGNLTVTPGYITQQTTSQALEQSRTRGFDLFARWAYSPTLAFRLSANQLFAVDTQTRTFLSNGNSSSALRSNYTAIGLGIEMKL